jgi:peroxiredoxin
MRKRMLVLAIAAVLITAAGLSAQLAENSPAPAFTLKDLAGKTITLDALRGKVVVLNFWATWCPPCRAEIPDFVEFYKENKAKGLEIVGVSVDTNTASQVAGFVQQNKIPYPVTMFTQKIVDSYGPIDAIPTTFVIDKTGRVRHVQVGMMDKETLAQVFAKLSASK